MAIATFHKTQSAQLIRSETGGGAWVSNYGQTPNYEIIFHSIVDVMDVVMARGGPFMSCLNDSFRLNSHTYTSHKARICLGT